MKGFVQAMTPYLHMNLHITMNHHITVIMMNTSKIIAIIHMTTMIHMTGIPNVHLVFTTTDTQTMKEIRLVNTTIIDSHLIHHSHPMTNMKHKYMQSVVAMTIAMKI